jgi:NADPH:quinone reductase-like Zn-dependent oxidoreductase
MLVMEAERFGGPQVLSARQVPDPVAGPGQIVVRTSAADLLFVDTFIRAGRRLPVRQCAAPVPSPVLLCSCNASVARGTCPPTR